MLKHLDTLGTNNFFKRHVNIWKNPKKFRDSGSSKQNAMMSDKSKVMQERGDSKLSAVILERHLTVYKWLQNFYAILKSLFCDYAT